MKKTLILLFSLTLLMGTVEIVKADPITLTFTGSSGSRSAEAIFNISGSTLTVTLTNTSTADVLYTNELLTALFFNVNGVGALTPVSAYLRSGSIVTPSWPDGGGNVGGEWAYGAGLSGAPRGATEGISSSGFGLFGNFNMNGVDLNPPKAVDGANYAITSAGDNLDSYQSNDVNPTKNPLIKNSVVFTLTGNFTNFMGISDVNFQYGTGLNEPNVTVPEPGILILLGIAMSAIGAASWKISNL